MIRAGALSDFQPIELAVAVFFAFAVMVGSGFALSALSALGGSDLGGTDFGGSGSAGADATGFDSSAVDSSAADSGGPASGSSSRSTSSSIGRLFRSEPLASVIFWRAT